MKRTRLHQMFALSALCGAMLLHSVGVQAVTDEEILDDANTTHQIVSNGLGLAGQRYSPLATVNVDTVQQLRPVWALSFGGRSSADKNHSP